MKNILVTGSKGFIGKNLLEALSRRKCINIFEFDIDADEKLLNKALEEADIIYHLAGVNRPEKDEEFYSGNTAFTQKILSALTDLKKSPVFVLSSSTQAELDNPYGISKRAAEDLVFKFGESMGALVYVYRLNNVFGKWCRPNYNSVVATFCYNISRDIDIVISDRARELELVYVEDVVNSFINLLDNLPHKNKNEFMMVKPTYRINLGSLAEMIYEFRNIRKTLTLPNLADDLTRRMHSTYLSYLDKHDFSYNIEIKKDKRGCLAELIKSKQFGQIFISKTQGRLERGNHYHNTKTEKFCVLQGEAMVRFRHILSNGEILSYHVSGDDLKIVDIPPGYIHCIENISDQELIVLFWADQIYDPDSPDTHSSEV